MHVWVVERWFRSGNWTLDTAYPTRCLARVRQAMWKSIYLKQRTRIRKYIPSPSLEDFDRWFEGEYGMRHSDEAYADVSDSDLLKRWGEEQGKGDATGIGLERIHREYWDLRREIALSALKAALSGFKGTP